MSNGSHNQRLRRNSPSASYIGTSSTSTPDPSSDPPGALQITANELQDIASNTIQSPAVRLPVAAQNLQIAKLRVQLCEFSYPSLLEEYGFYGLIATAQHECEIARQEHPFNKDVLFSKIQEWLVRGTQILSDMPPAVLQALLDGSLPRKATVNSLENSDVFQHFDQTNVEAFTLGQDVDISHWVSRLHSGGDHVPVIYTRIFHDSNGSSPSPNQLLQAADCLLKYVSGDRQHDAICAAIDNMSRPNTSSMDDIRNGRHHFLKGRTERVMVILTFVTALKEVLKDCDEEIRDQPWIQNLKYFGYCDDFARRANEHEAGQSSWLMTLFQHVFRHLCDEWEGEPNFSFHPYVMVFLISYKESRLAEELFCRMGCGYYYTGRGFNIANAGIRVKSSKLANISYSERKEMKQKLLNIRLRDTAWEAQYMHNFDTFWDKYAKRCEEQPDDEDWKAEDEALDREIEAAQAALDARKEQIGPYSKFRDFAIGRLRELDSIIDDPYVGPRAKWEREAFLKEAKGYAMEYWGEDLDI